MASMKFIVENDVPVALSCEGSTFDIISHVVYLIGSIYRMLRSRHPGHARMFQKSLSLVVTDSESPVWNIELAEGETDIAIFMPKGNSDNDGGE